MELAADTLTSVGVEQTIKELSAFLVFESDCVPINDFMPCCS
jgi:hypothetical protein